LRAVDDDETLAGEARMRILESEKTTEEGEKVIGEDICPNCGQPVKILQNDKGETYFKEHLFINSRRYCKAGGQR